MVTYLPLHHLINYYLLIRAQEGMQLVMALILHDRFFGVSGLINSPIANKYAGPLSLLSIITQPSTQPPSLL